jgi:YfiH family protein
MQQVHSSRVHEARKGVVDEGDAIYTSETNLALSVVTADCVPVLAASSTKVLAAHVGWRGLVGGIVEAAAEQLAAGSEGFAWIGPAIGSCCFEVSWEVARRIEGASKEPVIRPGRTSRPNIDLVGAVASVLRSRGVEILGVVDECTRCGASGLASYRRDGSSSSRNVGYIWRSPSES